MPSGCTRSDLPAHGLGKNLGSVATSRLQSFETELLTQEENLSGLAVINRELIARAETIESPLSVITRAAVQWRGDCVGMRMAYLTPRS